MDSCRKPPGRERFPAREFKEMSGPPKSCWQRMELTNVGSPKGREPYGDRVPVVVAGVTTCQGGREGRPQGEGAQVTGHREPIGMRNAECPDGTGCPPLVTREPRALKGASVVRRKAARKRTSPRLAPRRAAHPVSSPRGALSLSRGLAH